MLQGEEGVREVLQILNDEFRLSMALSGKTRMNEPWWCSRASTSNEGVCSLLVQAAGTWQRSTGTSFSSPSSDGPAEGSTVETVCTRRRPAEPQTVLGQKKWLEEDRKTLGGLCHIFSVYLCKTDLRARSTQPIIQVLLFFDIYFCPLGGWDRGINPSHQNTLGFLLSQEWDERNAVWHAARAFNKSQRWWRLDFIHDQLIFLKHNFFLSTISPSADFCFLLGLMTQLQNLNEFLLNHQWVGCSPQDRMTEESWPFCAITHNKWNIILKIKIYCRFLLIWLVSLHFETRGLVHIYLPPDFGKNVNRLLNQIPCKYIWGLLRGVSCLSWF